ncbi:hypothetical protein COO60DRAFT_361923 [Scenedesmus sp. NREL 46B-D3]|nr:hypothetical protein COO60DRAFT_361923 [Scenedesmus sp. NREL 46B-D3]
MQNVVPSKQCLTRSDDVSCAPCAMHSDPWCRLGVDGMLLWCQMHATINNSLCVPAWVGWPPVRASAHPLPVAAISLNAECCPQQPLAAINSQHCCDMSHTELSCVRQKHCFMPAAAVLQPHSCYHSITASSSNSKHLNTFTHALPLQAHHSLWVRAPKHTTECGTGLSEALQVTWDVHTRALRLTSSSSSAPSDTAASCRMRLVRGRGILGHAGGAATCISCSCSCRACTGCAGCAAVGRVCFCC